jgi:hypothetical protein
VRRDLAEIAVADRIFAQHYVEPNVVNVTTAAAIHAHPDRKSEVVALLSVTDIFHLLDLGHEWAWGRGEAAGSVGYVLTSALDLP